MHPTNYQYRPLDEDSMCLRHEHYQYFAPNVQIQVETSLVFLVHTVLEAILQSYLQRSLQDSHFHHRHKNHNRSISVVIALFQFQILLGANRKDNYYNPQPFPSNSTHKGVSSKQHSTE